MPTPANLFGMLVFGVIGSGAFMYGKKTAGWRAMSIGAALVFVPSFIDPTWLMYAVGAALTAALFVFRD